VCSLFYFIVDKPIYRTPNSLASFCNFFNLALANRPR